MNIQSAEFITGAADWSGLPEDGRPEVAFIGRSNVGKSSLINALLFRKNLARTSKTPGKTQQFNYYLINNRFYLVDLPGFGYAKVSKKERERWARFIEDYLNVRSTLRGVVHLVDSRHAPTRKDEDVFAFMKGFDVPYTVALTKVDKLSNNQHTKSVARAKKALKQMGLEAPVVPTSSEDGRGCKEVLRWMEPLIRGDARR